jgi:hypothetical protein
MRTSVFLCAVSLLLASMTMTPSVGGAADWLGWVSGDESFAATWVKDIEQELNKKDYRAVFLNDPRAPQASVLRLLNRAAMAYNAKNAALSEELVREALEVFEEGVRKHYYTAEDIKPIISAIRQRTPIKAA